MGADQVSADSLIGQTIGGRFVTTKLLGEGGMGYVFKAIQKPSNREVALKILKEDYMSDEVIRNRFLREAEVIAKMNHPNIIMLFDSGLEERNNVLFMAMEYLDGQELSTVIHHDTANLSLDRLLSITSNIAAALSEAHQHGIIHRDLKPENVYLIKDHEGRETAKVLDFGFARLQGSTKKLTQFGVAFGTPHYMSPEQAMGQLDITAAADIYAVGVMLYEMITGEVPYNGNNAMEIMTKQVNEAIPPIKPRAGVKPSKALIELTKHCMQKDPKQRPQDGSALLDMLQRIRAGQAIPSNVATVQLSPELAKSLPTTASAGGLQKQQLIYIGVGAVVLILLVIIVTVAIVG